jgi:hypothetical protein
VILADLCGRVDREGSAVIIAKTNRAPPGETGDARRMDILSAAMKPRRIRGL